MKPLYWSHCNAWHEGAKILCIAGRRDHDGFSLRVALGMRPSIEALRREAERLIEGRDATNQKVGTLNPAERGGSVQGRCLSLPPDGQSYAAAGPRFAEWLVAGGILR